MLRERVAPHSEVIRVIVLEDSPCCEVPHLHQQVEPGVDVKDHLHPRTKRRHSAARGRSADSAATRPQQAAGATAPPKRHSSKWESVRAGEAVGGCVVGRGSGAAGVITRVIAKKIGRME